jgi:hypothetical protein
MNPMDIIGVCHNVKTDNDFLLSHPLPLVLGDRRVANKCRGSTTKAESDKMGARIFQTGLEPLCPINRNI